ncbi:regulator of nonsense transcripts UPF3-like isoform X2 [Typha latifolia]|uniref:regulator of nonsense transcripts UPF3-like isoform X2 n=1 Tax=Typha latifolia TaxID=4733 RepID=UPI003C2EBD90
MRDPLDRTKVVLRRLPPAISQPALMEQIDGRFAGRYKWFCFRPGKSSQKNQRHSRAYISFSRPEDVFEFAESFDGHIFVNEKGAQYKSIVEYAPSQHVPKGWSKKDGHEGTIFKDPEYQEFLEILARPVEHLPSAEIQLERKEAERAVAPRDSLVVTPLMEYVRQRRAAKSRSQRSANVKSSRRTGGASPGSSKPSRRTSEKQRVSTPVYVLRDNVKSGSGKDKSTYLLVSRKDGHQLLNRPVAVTSAGGTEALENETAFGGTKAGKKVLLLKAKERERTRATDGSSHHQTSVRNLESSAFKQNQQQEGSGRVIRRILSKDASQIQPYLALSHSELQPETVNSDKDKRPPCPLNARVLKDHITSISTFASGADSDAKGAVSERSLVNDIPGSGLGSEKHGKGTRSKDRPDRAIWAPLRRTYGSHASDESLSTSSTSAQLLPDSLEGRAGFTSASFDVPPSQGEANPDVATAEAKILGAGFNSCSLPDNGLHKYSRRGPAHGAREVDSSLNYTDGKPSKRGGPGSYGTHERQVWVQKPGSGS